MDWTQIYPGLPSMVPAIRAFVRGLLGDTPRTDDAELVACELVTNALRHTPSGSDGGKVAVTVATVPGCARITVADAGSGAWTPPVSTDDIAEYGRGLLIVSVLADRFGHEANDEGQAVWAEFEWHDEASS
ncbi:ATP-binding protein [Actinomadura rubrobrunea]|uniref:ATP-binding protein n=1 Tax=Actinomadura rubrobrunea TaxID=115335 RepID=A0A9W6UWP6_9ACTN|nr:ATP-binding protein [Actinomadura rubrobrunea]GLW63890.1 ATP-binding protein [Actinomadura rubrobrunea]